MLVATLSVLATILTVLRSWPQFVRVVIRRNAEGVSALTWMLALAAHTGWMMFGVLSGIWLFVIVNFLSGAGCAGIVWKIRSPMPVAVTVAGGAALSAAVFQVGEEELLALVVGMSLAMFMPQAFATLRSNIEGVSPVAWTITALSSIVWLSWAFVIGRPTLVIAHFVMLPLAVTIALAAWRADRTDALTGEAFEDGPVPA